MNSVVATMKAGTYSSFDEIERLIRGFESGELPQSRWTHSAHLTVACWYLICHPEPAAVQLIREGIQRYNKQQGIITTEKSGYHETMTIFWIRMIRNFLSTATLECSLVGLINELVRHYSNKNLPFDYYTQERLMSWDARRSWIEPDLKALP
jgi:hypothetical protein